MRTILKSAVASMAIVAAAPLAFAQTATPSAPAPSASTQTASVTPPLIYTMPVSGGEWRSSDLVGKSVYNRTDQRIGAIEDLIIGADGKIHATVVGVGGFLGMGERKVAISYPAMSISRDKDGKLRPVVNATKETLKGAPEYKVSRAK